LCCEIKQRLCAQDNSDTIFPYRRWARVLQSNLRHEKNNTYSFTWTYYLNYAKHAHSRVPNAHGAADE